MTKYVAGKGGSFEEVPIKLEENEEARLAESEGGVTLVYPDGFSEWDEASAAISRDLQKPVFSFHIHDGDLWMFVLFVNGDEAAKFNPVPDYWEPLDLGERAKWLPSADRIAKYAIGVNSERIKPYLVEWPNGGLTGKAQPEDRFGFIDWQVVDLMRELGFRYPNPGEGNSYRFKIIGQPHFKAGKSAQQPIRTAGIFQIIRKLMGRGRS